MDHDATLDILDKMHDRICRIEAAAGYAGGDSYYTDYADYGGLAAKAGPGISQTIREIAVIFSDVINGRIKEFIFLQTKGYMLQHTEYVSEIAKIISIALSEMPKSDDRLTFKNELKMKLESIIIKEDWARGNNRDTHKYVQMIWEAFKGLGL
jgi:hypothetical protein